MEIEFVLVKADAWCPINMALVNSGRCVACEYHAGITDNHCMCLAPELKSNEGENDG